MGDIAVVNGSTEVVECQISNKTGGSADWYTLKPRDKDSWRRNGWESVNIKAGDRHSSLWVNRGFPATVFFFGFDKELVIHSKKPPPGAFHIANRTPQIIWACISGGSWNAIATHTSQIFPGYDGWQTVAFKNSDDSERKGVYITNKGTIAIVEFHGFDQEILTKDGSVNFLRDEYFAEAIAIADRSHFAQSTRASNPGGLVASVDKVNTIESLTPGKFESSFRRSFLSKNRWAYSEPMELQSNIHS